MFAAQVEDVRLLLKHPNEYNALRLSALLRYLLLDSQSFIHSLHHKMGRKFLIEANIGTSINDDRINQGTVLLYENLSKGSLRQYTLEQFLKLNICIIFGDSMNVRDLIRFLANKEGGVHFDNLNDGSRDDIWRKFVENDKTKRWLGGTASVYQGIFDVGDVVVRSLGPAYDLVKA